jgi:hypothetical protein
MPLPLLLSFLGSGLANAGVLGAAGSFLSNPLIMGAIGSGVGTAIETGDVGKGIGAGLGSFAGGKLLGDVMGAAVPATSTASVSGPMKESLVPVMRPPNLGQAAAPAGLGDIARAGMKFGSSAQGIGSMIGGTLGAGAMGPTEAPKTPIPDISQNISMQRTARTPGPEYVPGRSGEFDYGVSTPYTTDYVNQYAPVNMAGGGMVRHMVPKYGPVYMQAGGIANLGAAGAGPAPNEREIISAAISAILGKHPQPEIALGAFLANYGEDALRDLVDRVRSGEMQQSAEKSEGKLAGPGDGMSDMIPASIEGQQDVLLSDGEYIVPADVVSGLGNGSTDAGAKALDEMKEKIRMARTGRSEQAPAVPQEEMMPV